MKKRGNCYVTCEALYHLLGGKKAGWVPMTVRHEGDVHWYLEKGKYMTGGTVWNPFVSLWVLEVRLDPMASQFKKPPDYSKGRGRGFLTKKPSKRAREMMKRMVWQDI